MPVDGQRPTPRISITFSGSDSFSSSDSYQSFLAPLTAPTTKTALPPRSISLRRPIILSGEQGLFAPAFCSFVRSVLLLNLFLPVPLHLSLNERFRVGPFDLDNNLQFTAGDVLGVRKVYIRL